MFKSHRLIAAVALIGALATAGPVASASAAQPAAAAAPGTTQGSSVPCYPFPAFCGPNGQPAPWAPWWIRPALGLPPASVWQPVWIGPAPVAPLT
jgi:hypothetical protein